MRCEWNCKPDVTYCIDELESVKIEGNKSELEQVESTFESYYLVRWCYLAMFVYLIREVNQPVVTPIPRDII